MSLRLNRTESTFRTIRELSGIRTRDDIRLGEILPIDFMLVRQKLDQTFILKILLAVILNFPLLT